MIIKLPLVTVMLIAFPTLTLADYYLTKEAGECMVRQLSKPEAEDRKDMILPRAKEGFKSEAAEENEDNVINNSFKNETDARTAMAKLTECKPVTFYVIQAAQGCEVEKWSKTEAEENADSILGAFQDEEAARDAILDKDECQQDSGAYQGEESPFENGAWAPQCCQQDSGAYQGEESPVDDGAWAPQ